ncbi:MAG: arginine deiminase [Frankiaceae bacterium]|nr:arginine deiminase [Frankiaceae bacterium]MBV9871264.1 arginine deiminase [Frankiaceae bacterium]
MAEPKHGVDSEVGRLRTVLLHRPGPELARLTPRNSADLLFDGIPWVERAQQEHDEFAAALREHDVEVLILRDLLTETLAVDAAREEVTARTLSDQRLGGELRGIVAAHLSGLRPAELAEVCMAGITNDELAGGRGIVAKLMGPHEFIVPPLPNLLFTRDSSVWVGSHVAVTSPSMPARRRETWLTGAIYRHHPRFAGTPNIYSHTDEWLEGGDVLLLAAGVIAVGVGQRTRAAAVETLAVRAFAAGLAHTVLVVPIAQERATMHLDTVCTMVDVDAVVMYPAVADSLEALVVSRNDDGSHSVSDLQPFVPAAAKAMGIDVLRVIDTGLDPVTAEREQWDDGNNTLAIAPRLAVAYERNVKTNARLEAAGIEVVSIPGSELGSGRGGPRCMSCPIRRDTL